MLSRLTRPRCYRASCSRYESCLFLRRYPTSYYTSYTNIDIGTPCSMLEVVSSKGRQALDAASRSNLSARMRFDFKSNREIRQITSSPTTSTTLLELHLCTLSPSTHPIKPDCLSFSIRLLAPRLALVSMHFPSVFAPILYSIDQRFHAGNCAFWAGKGLIEEALR